MAVTPEVIRLIRMGMAFIHSRTNGQLNKQVTRYPNMFAMMFGYLDSAKTEAVKNNALMNDKVRKITTPYMRFYELAALAEIGQQTYVTKEIKDYWGGMLQEGATTFWEQYYPDEEGAARYAMYGPVWQKPVSCLGCQSIVFDRQVLSRCKANQARVFRIHRRTGVGWFAVDRRKGTDTAR